MKKKQEEDYAERLRESHERWQTLYTQGGNDPYNADGVSMRLARNHILYYYKKIEEEFDKKDYPEIFFKGIPPELPDEYMARPDEIRAAARASLKIYQENPDYQYILEHQDDFTQKTLDKLYVHNALAYVSGLKNEIAKDDLVMMRRHEEPEWCLYCLKACADRMKELSPEDVQLTLSLGF
ncbi:MAG: hypothetical protein LBN36_04645 [Clostridiales Family XIII bacterium]|jgi:hypothetical protein|nr:hypothetical protein [Clostridiales Family XIII bacterium]